MNIAFTHKGWNDYQHWVKNDRSILHRTNTLIEDARRNLHTGLGKPEPLKRELTGWWSRRITGRHRLVYRIVGQPGVDQRIEIAACRDHYE